jgi:hypothetical protein
LVRKLMLSFKIILSDICAERGRNGEVLGSMRANGAM